MNLHEMTDEQRAAHVGEWTSRYPTTVTDGLAGGGGEPYTRTTAEQDDDDAHAEQWWESYYS